MRTLLFVFSFRILLLWLHFRIEFSISELCSIWIVKIIMFTIVNDEDVDKEDEDNNDCDYDIGDDVFVEDGDDVFVDGSEDGDHNFFEEYRCWMNCIFYQLCGVCQRFDLLVTLNEEDTYHYIRRRGMSLSSSLSSVSWSSWSIFPTAIFLVYCPTTIFEYLCKCMNPNKQLGKLLP